MEKIIRKYALQNAVLYDGKATANAVLGKVLKEKPELKKDIEKLRKTIELVVKEVNALSKENQIKELEKTAPELLEKKHEEKKGLKELPDAKKGKVIMRFEPSPSGPLHVGHAYVGCLISEYCNIYNGKYILRIGDTNPENIYGKAYEMIREDGDWLFGNVSEFYVQSDRMERYYETAEQLIRDGHMYVCSCSQEDFKDLKDNMQECPCRNLPAEKHLLRWEKMLTMYKEGEAVVRFKTDIKHKNPAMRDFGCLRICETEHSRQGRKYRVWPLMIFSVAVDDYDYKMTHIIRAKDHMDNAKKEEFIFDALKFKHPVTIFVGRINFEGFEVSCTKTREKIEQGIYTGWDDIRIPFIPALRRRGYQPDAFRKYAVDVGVTQTDKSVTMDEFFKAVNFFNKEIIDPKSYRYFFVANPELININNAPEQAVELDLHPDNKKGGRKFKTKQEFYIAAADAALLKGNELTRLMDCLNFMKKGSKYEFISTDYEKFKEKGKHIIHWLPKSDDLVDVEVLMPDNTTVKGLGEKTLSKLKIGGICQLERFGFCRLDDIEDGKLKFWFAHR